MHTRPPRVTESFANGKIIIEVDISYSATSSEKHILGENKEVYSRSKDVNTFIVMRLDADNLGKHCEK